MTFTGLKLRPWAPLITLMVLCLGFSVGAPGFASVNNLSTIAERSAIPLILAVGVTFVILQGAIDLSVEGVMAVSSLTFALLVLNSRTALDLGLLGGALGILAGAGLGFLSGLIVARLRVPSFMVTLGVWSIGTGIATLLSGDQPPLIKDQMLRGLGLGRTLAAPNLVVIAIVILVIGYVLQSYTRFGRYSLMIGGGEDLVRLSGIPVERYKVLAFAFAGSLSGLAGVLESARIGLGHVDIGSGEMFATITAIAIGGTSLGGGRGGVLQSAVGTFMLAVISDGMIFVGITPYLQRTILGVLILLAMVAMTWRVRARLRVVK